MDRLRKVKGNQKYRRIFKTAKAVPGEMSVEQYYYYHREVSESYSNQPNEIDEIPDKLVMSAPPLLENADLMSEQAPQQWNMIKLPQMNQASYHNLIDKPNDEAEHLIPYNNTFQPPEYVNYFNNQDVDGGFGVPLFLNYSNPDQGNIGDLANAPVSNM